MKKMRRRDRAKKKRRGRLRDEECEKNGESPKKMFVYNTFLLYFLKIKFITHPV